MTPKAGHIDSAIEASSEHDRADSMTRIEERDRDMDQVRLHLKSLTQVKSTNAACRDGAGCVRVKSLGLLAGNLRRDIGWKRRE